jgi:hypothetical protein
MSESVVAESIVNTANPAPGSARNPMHAGGSDLRMLADGDDSRNQPRAAGTSL